MLVDARLRIFVGGVSDSRCRNRSILAPVSADKGGVRIGAAKTGQARPLPRRAGASAAGSYQSASDRAAKSATKRDPYVRRFELTDRASVCGWSPQSRLMVWGRRPLAGAFVKPAHSA